LRATTFFAGVFLATARLPAAAAAGARFAGAAFLAPRATGAFAATFAAAFALAGAVNAQKLVAIMLVRGRPDGG
jgi:hypothetical protein